MRRLAWHIALAMTVVGGLVGCGTQTIVKTVNAPNQGAATSTATSTSQAQHAQQARVGDPLTLTGAGGLSMAVTVDQVMDPLQVGEDDQADSGQRYVGVQITLKNVGSVAYSDSPSNGATLLSNTNEQAQSEVVSGGPCSNDFGSSANIASGDTQQGCLAFELPTGETPSTFQFTLNSGFADQTGQWSLAGAVATTSATGTGPSGASSGSGSSAGTQCDANISAGPDTSCPFAENVFKAYYQTYKANGAQNATVTTSSPVTGQTYSMQCAINGGTVTCTGGDNAMVTFPLHAIQVY